MGLCFCMWNGCRANGFLTVEQLVCHVIQDHVDTTCTLVCRWMGCMRSTPFSQRQKLIRHIRTHVGYKAYRCDDCGKCFLEAHALKQHVRVHTNERPYPCTFEGCGKGFKTSSALTAHMRGHKGERPFVCVCGQRFADASNLNKHKKIHDERRYGCMVEGCGKKFARMDQLKRHVKTHEC
jgi:uncharacterized Zn-finger protein